MVFVKIHLVLSIREEDRTTQKPCGRILFDALTYRRLAPSTFPWMPVSFVRPLLKMPFHRSVGKRKTARFGKVFYFVGSTTETDGVCALSRIHTSARSVHVLVRTEHTDASTTSPLSVSAPETALCVLVFDAKNIVGRVLCVLVHTFSVREVQFQLQWECARVLYAVLRGHMEVGVRVFCTGISYTTPNQQRK